MTRRLALLACVAALCAPVLAGCGERDAALAPPPRPAQGGPDPDRRAEEIRRASKGIRHLPTMAAERAKPDAGMQARLDEGEVAVVDLTGRIGIRPEKLAIASGGELSKLDWTRWDAEGAEGTGELRALVCDPDCARGVLEYRRVRIELSEPTTCPRGRFFGASSVEAEDTRPADQPTSYLAAPCG